MSDTPFYPRGFHTSYGYIGLLSGNKKIMFPTEQEYLDYISDDDS